MDEKVVMDFLVTISEKLSIFEKKYDRIVSYNESYEKDAKRTSDSLSSIDKKLDETWDKVTELKKDIDYIKQDNNEMKCKLKTELDTVWHELRKTRDDLKISFESEVRDCTYNCEKNLQENFAKKIYVDNKASSIKLWILTSSITLLLAMVSYFLIKAFNKVTVG